MKEILPVFMQTLRLIPSPIEPLQRRSEDDTVANFFKSLEPSPELSWTPCFQKFTCAMLEVPLDYEDVEAGTTNIAFVKRSSTNATAEDILLNPGGPGAGGVDFVLSDAETNGIFGVMLGGQYNLVGFDPRGVDNSDINLGLCDTAAVPVTETSANQTLRTLYDRRKEFNVKCSRLQENTTSRYASTVAVAADMLHYTELRAKGLGQPPNSSKLWFYGASYGTILGATFASLYPSRIGRIILDGVADSDEQYAGAEYSSLADTDKAVASFFTFCWAAGPSRCAWAKKPKNLATATSAKQLQSRFNDLLTGLATRYNATRNTKNADQNIDPSIVKRAFFMSLYNPLRLFPVLADGLYGLQNGNDTAFGVSIATIFGAVDEEDDDTGNAGSSGDSALPQINCLDTAGRFNQTFEEFRSYASVLANVSYYAGDSLSGTFCAGFDIQPPPSQVFQGRIGSNNVSSPLLFISTVADPITPLVSANQMSSQFAGSAVLVVNSTGVSSQESQGNENLSLTCSVIKHTSGSSSSRCVYNHIQSYLSQNKLPLNNTVCQSDITPFFLDVAQKAITGDADRSFNGFIMAAVMMCALAHIVAWFL